MKDNKLILMSQGGKKLAQIRRLALSKIKEGVTPAQLNELIERLIKKENAEASFKQVAGYHFASCICPNEVVVHGIPADKPLKEGDIVGVDIGLFYKGFHTDTAETVMVGSKNREIEKMRFLKAGKIALSQAIKKAITGNHVGDISLAIQQTIEDKGYNVVRNFVGHGIGKRLHQPPGIPCFLNKPLDKTPKLQPDATLAIEVIYTMGRAEVVVSDDGWTAVTKDGSLAGLFEHTVVVGKKAKVLTI